MLSIRIFGISDRSATHKAWLPPPGPFLQRSLRRYSNICLLPLTPRLLSLHLYTGSENEGCLLSSEYLDTLHGSIPWKTLQSFGAYSTMLPFTESAPPLVSETANGILTRLTRMQSHERRSLRRLDIVNGTIAEEVFDSVRSQFTTLESLTIRGSLRDDGKIWDNDQKWNPNHNLTCLQLIDCSGVYSAHVPKFLRLFPSLKKLLISGCGNWGDDIPPARAEGWSRQPDALHRQPPHLDEFHIEHMVTWEILAMGEISSRTVIATGLPEGDIYAPFKADPEIFPGLRHLKLDLRNPRTLVTEIEPNEDAAITNVEGRTSPLVATEPMTSGVTEVDELEQLCRIRGIELTWDWRSAFCR